MPLLRDGEKIPERGRIRVQGHRCFSRFGGSGAYDPVLEIGSEVIIGFDKTRIKKALGIA